jgi:hypothetical protein
MHAVVQHGGSTRLIGLTSFYKDGAIIRMGHLCRLGHKGPGGEGGNTGFVLFCSEGYPADTGGWGPARTVKQGCAVCGVCAVRLAQGGNSSSGLAAAEDGSGAVWTGDLIVEVRGSSLTVFIV